MEASGVSEVIAGKRAMLGIRGHTWAAPGAEPSGPAHSKAAVTRQGCGFGPSAS